MSDNHYEGLYSESYVKQLKARIQELRMMNRELMISYLLIQHILKKEIKYEEQSDDVNKQEQLKNLLAEWEWSSEYSDSDKI